MKLSKIHKIKITPTVPFSFNTTFYKPDHFTTDDHLYEKGIRWQTFNWKGRILGVKFINQGSVDKPLIVVEVYSKEVLGEAFLNLFRKEILYRYNLNLDLNEFYDKYSSNSLLNKAIKNLRGMRPGHSSSLYEYLMIGIVLQNASVKRSIQMFKNLLFKYGTKVKFDDKELLCIWSKGCFDDIDEQELRELKVGYRAKSIKRVDSQFSNEKIDEFDMRSWNIGQQKEALLSLYGIGPATVWYILFDVFHRWDVFEHISPWEQKIYSKLFFDKGVDDLASVDELLEYINSFEEYKHLAVHYIWEDLWWKRENGEEIEWFEEEIRG